MVDEYDLNKNGELDPDEREIMLEDRRRRMEDADHKRDAQLRMTWFALVGLLVYPFGIVLGDRPAVGRYCADIFHCCVRPSRCVLWVQCNGV